MGVACPSSHLSCRSYRAYDFISTAVSDNFASRPPGRHQPHRTPPSVDRPSALTRTDALEPELRIANADPKGLPPELSDERPLLRTRTGRVEHQPSHCREDTPRTGDFDRTPAQRRHDPNIPDSRGKPPASTGVPAPTCVVPCSTGHIRTEVGAIRQTKSGRVCESFTRSPVESPQQPEEKPKF